MEKETCKDGKKHRLPPIPSGDFRPQVMPPFPGEKEIHRVLGFRICSFNRNARYAPMGETRPRCFSFYSLAHMIDGRGFFWQEGASVEPLEPGDAVLMPPGVVHSYGGSEADFVEDYICFEGDTADRLFHAGLLVPGIRRLGTERRLLPFIELALNQSDDGQIRASLEFQKFLSDIFRENRTRQFSSGDRRIDELLLELNQSSRKWWTVQEMALFCRLSPNQFRRLFKEHTGKNPKRYVEELKIQLATESLSRPGARIADVARSLGYVDAYHFSKVFKKVMGLAPDHYRRHYSHR